MAKQRASAKGIFDDDEILSNVKAIYNGMEAVGEWIKLFDKRQIEINKKLDTIIKKEDQILAAIGSPTDPKVDATINKIKARDKRLKAAVDAAKRS